MSKIKYHSNNIDHEYEACSYCYAPKVNKISCCGENHWEIVYVMDDDVTLTEDEYCSQLSKGESDDRTNNCCSSKCSCKH